MNGKTFIGWACALLICASFYSYAGIVEIPVYEPVRWEKRWQTASAAGFAADGTPDFTLEIVLKSATTTYTVGYASDTIAWEVVGASNPLLVCYAEYVPLVTGELNFIFDYTSPNYGHRQITNTEYRVTDSQRRMDHVTGLLQGQGIGVTDISHVFISGATIDGINGTWNPGIIRHHVPIGYVAYAVERNEHYYNYTTMQRDTKFLAKIFTWWQPTTLPFTSAGVRWATEDAEFNITAFRAFDTVGDATEWAEAQINAGWGGTFHRGDGWWLDQ